MGMMIRRNKMEKEARAAAEKQAALAEKENGLPFVDVPEPKAEETEEPKKRGRRPKFED